MHAISASLPTARPTPSKAAHLYLVEDDATLRSMLSTYFAEHGFEVTAMDSAEELLDRLAQRRPDLVLLDIALRGMSGLEACQQLRRRGDDVRIIMLTARTDEADRIVGLEVGADDYINKPFSARELLARARAILRRGPAAPPVVTGKTETTVRIGEWTFMPESHSLHRKQQVRMLNTVEYALLAELTKTPGVPVARERLLAVSHVRKETALLRAVDASIMRLRRIVESNPSFPRYIQTVRFHGYVFVPHHAEGQGL